MRRRSASRRLTGGDAQVLTFEHAIIATGSYPTRVPGLTIDSPRVMDSTGALDLPDIPKSLLVVGGGYIGLELGSVYAALGTKVTVVEMTDGLLPGADRDLVTYLVAPPRDDAAQDPPQDARRRHGRGARRRERADGRRGPPG